MSLKWIATAAVAVLAAGLSAASAAARPTAVNGPRAVTGVSPYAAGCDTSDIEAQGFGERVADTETEAHLAVDPRDTRNLVVGWMQDLYRGYATAWSTNAGASWSTSIVPGNTRATRSSSPPIRGCRRARTA